MADGVTQSSRFVAVVAAFERFATWRAEAVGVGDEEVQRGTA